MSPASTSARHGRRWRPLDHPARETGTLESSGHGWTLRGDVAGMDETANVYRLRCTVECDASWLTRTATVEGRVAGEPIRIELAPLDQVYRHAGDSQYAYESAGGRFRALLDVDDDGLIVRYGKYWISESPGAPGDTPQA